MKIDKFTPPLPASQTGEVAARSGNAKPAASSESGTSVSLGAASAHLHTMESSMAGTPLVNAAKVAEIKQAISSGQFKVNSGAVADRLISSVQDMLGSSQR